MLSPEFSGLLRQYFSFKTMVLFGLLLVIGTSPLSSQPFQMDIPSKIIVGDDINYPPYSFLDEDGNPTGFNIAIATRVAEVMGLEVEFRLGEWSSIREALQKGEIDAISGMFFSTSRNESYDFTIRHSISNGDIFSAKGKSIKDLNDLRGQTIVVQKADIIAEYLSQSDMNFTIVEVHNVDEALKLIEDGVYDHAGLLKLPGLYSIRKNNYRNIIHQGLVLLPNDYSMAVKKGNEDLLFTLNTGLHVLKLSDEYREIYDEWLGVYEEQSFWINIIRYKWFIFLGMSMLTGLIVISIMLNFLVKKKTRELQLLNKDLMEKNKLLAESKNKLHAQLVKINEQGEIIQFKQNFLANMSHEIRTPLNGILGMGEILSQTSLTTEQREYISTLKQSGENLMEIINQVLDYSKIEAGKLQLKKSTFALKELNQSIHNLFKSICHKKITFYSRMDRNLPRYVVADKNRILQILNNLISNAVKFTSEGEIKLEFQLDQQETDGVSIRVIVSDTGMGIPVDQQQKLFRPFTQIHEGNNRQVEGTGLGLSICKELAVLHGGDIGLTSTYGSGSTFWFTFVAETVDEQKYMQQNNASSPLHKDKKLRILLVEDKKVNQKVISLILTSVGHKIVIAENGQEALERYKDGEYDLILMDIQMPVMDGITATAQLKQTHNNLPPIIGLSANAFEGDREKYMNLGMDEYLTKPFKKEDFNEIVKRVLV
jgi:signal transduction histidine kinase